MRFSASFFALSLVISAGISLPAVAKADTITVGNDPTVNGGTLDNDSSDTYILPGVFSSAGYIVTSYSFYGGQSGTITPLLFTGVSSGGYTTFNILGVGTTQTGTADGLNTYAFGLTSGTDVTTDDTYFGFENSNGSDVVYAYDTTTGGTFLVGSDSVYSPIVEENTTQYPDSLGVLNNRTYSIEATAVSPTPEPNSLVLLGTGLLGVCGLARRRFAKA